MIFNCEVIYTFANDEQGYSENVAIDLRSTQSAKWAILRILERQNETRKLVKASLCVYSETNPRVLDSDDLPKWFLDCNGKLWLNE